VAKSLQAPKRLLLGRHLAGPGLLRSGPFFLPLFTNLVEGVFCEIGEILGRCAIGQMVSLGGGRTLRFGPAASAKGGFHVDRFFIADAGPVAAPRFAIQPSS
jgi:hypothetical protein